uniref:CDK-activating kinase assembly factor MAT1 n=1 Tax=Lynceus sp. MCZ IZ 141354 TaxID=1930659 RepID=A0A9N6ZEQ5_9CRUS|nr:EOG090X0BPM [Lynceus sp. MCZ IZ 141354]
MDELMCPRCKTTKYRNPSLVLMVNICGHALCESCVELLFVKGSGLCPECSTPVRRGNFRVQLFEDPTVDKEVDIRKRVLRDFNKRQEDFSTLREYNDYLEDIETIIFNLVNNLDVVNTNKKIEAYKRDNKDVIQRNRNKQSQDEIELENILEMEEMEKQEKSKQHISEEQEERKKKLKAKEALIDELMFSDVDAKSILASHAVKLEKIKEKEATPLKEKPKQQSQFSSGVHIGFKGQQGGFLPVPKQKDLPLYQCKPCVIDYLGPSPPPRSSIVKLGYCANIRSATTSELAGGYMEAISCHRALQEAMNGLFHIPRSHDTEPMESSS